ncbi:type II secretion system F family protein [Lucifera butyrica]|uniref:type II secretion system F family protein n=1 Tax=Lucifera butyrica TaxID=1351585 RepID=UPI000F0310A3|nr:type II secretion system F family protein [Lucifera butyrica]
MIILIAGMTFLIIFILAYLALNTFVPAAGPVSLRLRALEEITRERTDIEEELSKPFLQRFFTPVSGSLAAVLARLAPQAIRRLAEQKLLMAGGFGGLNADQFLLLTVFLALLLPGVVVLGLVMAAVPVHKIIGITMICLAVGLSLPLLLVNQKIAGRRANIQKDLPDVLDLLTVSVEAGLGFDGALVKLTEKMKGALVEEFSRLLQEIRIGVSRRDALHAMGQRCDVPDLSLFVTALVQADQLGVSIGNVLRVQSAGMREKRRQRAEEKAMKAPVKMLFPLVMFIFPTIFVVLLGPAFIQIFTMFTKR